jgi:hypothetical protein
MNHAYDVLVLGPTGRGRETLERTLRRLGHSVLATEFQEGRELAAADLHDVVVVDARDEGGDPTDLIGMGVPESQPLLVVATQPSPMMRALFTRRGGAMVLTGAESDPGYQVALSVCAALRRTRRTRTGALA